MMVISKKFMGEFVSLSRVKFKRRCMLLKMCVCVLVEIRISSEYILHTLFICCNNLKFSTSTKNVLSRSVHFYFRHLSFNVTYDYCRYTLKKATAAKRK